MSLPSTADINEQRVQKFKEKLGETLANEDLGFFRKLVQEYQEETESDPIAVAAALACLAQGEQPLLLKDKPMPAERTRTSREYENDKPRSRDAVRGKSGSGEDKKRKGSAKNRVESDVPLQTYRLEVGRTDGVKPGEIVGAIANEADIDSKYIGYIKINDDHSTVQLPAGMPDEVLRILQKARVCQKPMRLRAVAAEEAGATQDRPRPAPRPRKRDARKPE